MKIRNLMTPDIEVVTPEDTLRSAARLMADLEFEALPVSEGDRLIGIITGRDIAHAVAAEGADPKTLTVGRVMTCDALYCFEEEPADEVSQKMADWWVRRLPVVNRRKRVVGMVSMADITTLSTPKPKASRLRSRRSPATRSARKARPRHKTAAAA